MNMKLEAYTEHAVTVGQGNTAPQKSSFGLAAVRFQPAVASAVGSAIFNQIQSAAAAQSEVKYCSVASRACECSVIKLPGRETL